MRAIVDDGLFRLFGRSSGEIAYAKFCFDLRAEIEFPSTWHEYRRCWVRLGLGIFKIALSFPWPRVSPDHGQCAGPRYGFAFFGDALWIYYGQDHGNSDHKRYKAIYLPWAWEHVRHDYLNADGSLHRRAGQHDYSAPDETKQQHTYRYVRRSGEVQDRTATINGEEREWRWRWFQWLPWPRMICRTINIEFNDEVGEGTGSWKGGVVGTSYEWKRGETMEQALRRMELNRKFSR